MPSLCKKEFYEMSIPAVVVKITGKAPLLATISQNRYCNVISEWKFSKSAALQEVVKKIL